MRVLFITTYNSACGIATYSANLIEELEKRGAAVQVYANTNDYLGLTRLAREYQADIIHIQHEYGISLPIDSLMSVVSKFQTAGMKVVVTTHTEDQAANIMLDGVPDAVILHNDVQNLAARRMFSRFEHIPHGIPEITFSEPREFYRKKYGIPEGAFVIGTCGFMSQDRAQMLETLVQRVTELAKSDINKTGVSPYFHLVMSAHRSDTGGQFANLVKSTLTNLMASFGMADRIQVNTEFIPVQEFRERIHTFDLGFSCAPAHAVSNSGSAADLLSCGVPTVVNAVPHFNSIAPYCTVVKGGINEVSNEVYRVMMEMQAHPDKREALVARVSKVIKDLGYGRAAEAHIRLYRELLAGVKPEARPSKPSILLKDAPVTITMPNSLWQVLAMWTKLQALKDEHVMRLVVQNDGLTDVSLLRWLLPGLKNVEFADVGLQQDRRLVRLQSRAVAQNLTFDVEAWLRAGQDFEDLAAWLPAAPLDLQMGANARKRADTLVKPGTTIVMACADTERMLNQVGAQLDNAIILSTPMMAQHAQALAASTGWPVYVEDLRTCWACCQQAERVISELDSCLVVAALAGVKARVICAPEDLGWQLGLMLRLRDLRTNKDAHGA